MADPITDTILQPQNIDNTPSSICSTGVTPVIATGIFLWVIRHLFSDPAYITTKSLQKYIWNADSTQSKILIEPITSWTPANLQTLQQRPAILIRRGPWAPIKLGFADRYHNTYPRVDNSRDISDNNSIKYEVILSGSHIVYCLGGQGAESEAIASEVFYYLLEFSQVIRQDYGFNMLKINNMGAAIKLEEAHEHWAVPITIEYAVNHAWNLRQHALPLKSITMIVE